MNKNYFISKDNKNGEVVYLEYNKTKSKKRRCNRSQ